MVTGDTTRENEAFLLGCGRSILNLKDSEIEYINRAKCVIALNKFMAFYKTVGIRPTHVWFTDVGESAPRVLQYIFDVCGRDGLQDLTFILAKNQGSMFSNKYEYWKAKLHRFVYKKQATWRIYWLPARLHATSRFQFVDKSDWLEGASWARTLEEPLYQHRTSFTAALNYLAITRPGSTVHLVGVDFNSSGYFFQEEMERLGLDTAWRDWTTDIVAKEGKHIALVPHHGGTIADAFPFIRQQLTSAGIRLVCPNPESSVVTERFAEYQPILPAEAVVETVGESTNGSPSSGN